MQYYIESTNHLSSDAIVIKNQKDNIARKFYNYVAVKVNIGYSSSMASGISGILTTIFTILYIYGISITSLNVPDYYLIVIAVLIFIGFQGAGIHAGLLKSFKIYGIGRKFVLINKAIVKGKLRDDLDDDEYKNLVKYFAELPLINAKASAFWVTVIMLVSTIMFLIDISGLLLEILPAYVLVGIIHPFYSFFTNELLIGEWLVNLKTILNEKGIQFDEKPVISIKVKAVCLFLVISLIIYITNLMTSSLEEGGSAFYLIISFGYSLFICMLLIYFIFKSILISFNQISNSVKALGKGEELLLFPKAHDKEIIDVVNDLNQSIKMVIEYNRTQNLVNENLRKLNEKIENEVYERTVELKKALVKAQESEKLKSAFLATMSHEIRTPLNPIIGYVDVILLKKDLPEDVKEYVRIIRDSGKLLLNLINDILDISKIEAGLFIIENVPSKLAEIIENSIKLGKGIIKDKKKLIELSFSIDENIYPVVSIDPVRLAQIINNMLSNAIKFTDKGFVSLEVILENDSTMKFIVQDTGIGIEKENQELIFDPFSQADSSISREYGGTGLGLSIIKKLVHLMNGEIWLTSDIGKGTTFCFTLPYIMAEIEEPKGKEISDRITDIKDHYTVLIADDHIVSLKLTSDFLKKHGYKVITVHDGNQAIKEYADSSKSIDLIIMDFQMPVMDGLEAVRQIRMIEKKNELNRIPILIVSATVIKEKIEELLESGADLFLQKPIQQSELLGIVNKELNNIK